MDWKPQHNQPRCGHVAGNAWGRSFNTGEHARAGLPPAGASRARAPATSAPDSPAPRAPAGIFAVRNREAGKAVLRRWRDALLDSEHTHVTVVERAVSSPAAGGALRGRPSRAGRWADQLQSMQG